MDTDVLYLSERLHTACVAYSLDRNHAALSDALELVSKDLVHNRDARQVSTVVVHTRNNRAISCVSPGNVWAKRLKRGLILLNSGCSSPSSAMGISNSGRHVSV